MSINSAVFTQIQKIQLWTGEEGPESIELILYVIYSRYWRFNVNVSNHNV